MLLSWTVSGCFFDVQKQVFAVKKKKDSDPSQNRILGTQRLKINLLSLAVMQAAGCIFYVLVENFDSKKCSYL